MFIGEQSFRCVMSHRLADDDHRATTPVVAPAVVDDDVDGPGGHVAVAVSDPDGYDMTTVGEAGRVPVVGERRSRPRVDDIAVDQEDDTAHAGGVRGSDVDRHRARHGRAVGEARDRDCARRVRTTATTSHNVDREVVRLVRDRIRHGQVLVGAGVDLVDDRLEVLVERNNQIAIRVHDHCADHERCTAIGGIEGDPLGRNLPGETAIDHQDVGLPDHNGRDGRKGDARHVVGVNPDHERHPHGLVVEGHDDDDRHGLVDRSERHPDASGTVSSH